MIPSVLQPTSFVAGSLGAWTLERVVPVVGASLAIAPRLAVVEGEATTPDGERTWSLRGITGHARYVERREKTRLDPVSPPLGRDEATCAVLIPIRKSPQWWALTQDERREIFESRSHHIADSMPYLPRIARRLYQARELSQPFDFLTWFEFAPEHTQAFRDLLAMLRSREEWTFVEREVEVWLSR